MYLPLQYMATEVISYTLTCPDIMWWETEVIAVSGCSMQLRVLLADDLHHNMCMIFYIASKILKLPYILSS